MATGRTEWWRRWKSRGGRAAVDDQAYPDMREFFSDLARVYREEIQALAEAGCAYLQIDDTNLAYLCDPKMRENAKRIGEDPDKLPALYAVGMRWRPTFDVASEGVREVARLMGPRIIGLAAAQVNFIVVIFFASFVSDAAISAVNYAFLMAMLPVGVVRAPAGSSGATSVTLIVSASAPPRTLTRPSMSRTLNVSA